MSQKFLRNPAVVPRSGFVYRDEETKQLITAGSFQALVKNTVNHRNRNNLSTDSKIVDKIHTYLCDNNPPEFCLEGYRGLGDVVHEIAQPIAGLIDGALGTNIRGCWTCAGRREALNNAVKFQK